MTAIKRLRFTILKKISRVDILRGRYGLKNVVIHSDNDVAFTHLVDNIGFPYGEWCSRCSAILTVVPRSFV